MNWLRELAYLLTISGSFYIALACICRLRYSDISPIWSTVYACFMGHSLWAVSNIVNNMSDSRDVTITLTVTLYMFMTKNSWATGVPEIAKRKRVENA